MADQILENVYVSCEPDDSMFNIICTIPCKSLKYNSSGVTYVLIELPENIECHSATFMNTLRFTVKDVDSDPSDPGLLDEYQVSYSISCHEIWLCKYYLSNTEFF
uniref:SJCHGC06766 protein n=1 Tax=Schistosoma japonicum TaxID=6182 RepID=Q5DA95_SCHJA|nr:SJCHGC06766 protein [Schistosoma japonicum]